MQTWRGRTPEWNLDTVAITGARFRLVSATIFSLTYSERKGSSLKNRGFDNCATSDFCGSR